MTWTKPQYLVETDWLAMHLDDPALRLLECTAILHPRPEGGYRAESGRSIWAAGHIPGSGFADLTADLCDRTSRLRFMMPPVDQMAAAMAQLGVGEGTHVVLYDRAVNMWAARVWWMLRAVGFDHATVLNGGWRKWTLDGRPTSTEPCAYPPGRFVPRPRPELFVGKDAVLAGLGQRATCVLNALTDVQHRGAGGVTYGRPGRIAGSANVPAQSLPDPTTHCGGGIAASSDAFVLTLLGHAGVAVYDASLSEWAADPSLPMDAG
jgi:thiosulfate/3-mercaptopyruvate sulfurtransferase